MNENCANAASSSWIDALRAADAVFEAGMISCFGNPDEDLAAATEQTIACPLLHLGLIKVSGEDARSFLHSQFTSDINHLGADVVQHSAWCSAKGRMIASFIVWRDGDSYLLALSSDLVEAVAKRLQMFVLRAKVSIAICGDSAAMIGVSGPHLGDTLGKAALPLPEPMHSAPCAGGSVVRLDSARVIVCIASERAADTWRQLTAAARPVGTPAWNWLDIREGLPMVSAATREHFVPQMANFERIGGVSFHKGCYPGQEIVARTQYLGKVKRHLFRVRADVPLAAGNELFSPAAPDQSCGMVVTASGTGARGYSGLAVLMEAAVEAGVHLSALDGPILAADAVAT